MKKPASLKVLDAVQVETPCHESWDAMQGDAQKRFCGQCRHSVNNISEMTREEAAAVIAAAGPGRRVCVRFRRGADGEIQYKPTASRTAYPAVLKRAAMVAFGVMAFLRLGSNVHAEQIEQGDVAAPPKEERMIMGEIAAPPSQTPAPTVAPERTLPCHTMGLIAPPTKAPEKTPAPRRDLEVMGKIKAPAK